ncbi:MAG: hypothetical protein R2838_00920 [Caldilineaceae bacterium]
MNLKDSGLDVRVGLHAGSKSKAKAEAEGLLDGTGNADAAAEADIIMLLLPDPIQSQGLRRGHCAQISRTDDTVMFAHGFNIRYGFISPPENVDVSMVAPKAPYRVREVFMEGSGVPALVAIHQDASGGRWPITLAYAKGMGCTAPVCSKPPSRGDRDRSLRR